MAWQSRPGRETVRKSKLWEKEGDWWKGGLSCDGGLNPPRSIRSNGLTGVISSAGTEKRAGRITFSL
jgi:hypothetical protein